MRPTRSRDPGGAGAGATMPERPQSSTVDAVDLESLAWRAVELSVQRRHDPRLVVATRRSLTGPAATARLIAGLCNASAGRLAIALFGVDGADVVGVAERPDPAWLDTVAARFPGVVPTMATATIDADGAHVVAITAEDPGTPVIATRGGRAIVPWFDGTLADAPPPVDPGDRPRRATGRLEVRSGWIQRSRPFAPPHPTAGVDPTMATARRGRDVTVWRGVLDIACALATSTEPGGTTAAGGAAAGRSGGTTIDDRDVSVTLLADGATPARSLDVQIHPAPPTGPAIRGDCGVVVDPLVPLRLYLAAATGVDTAEVDPDAVANGSVRLLVSVRLPGDEILVAAVATLRRRRSDAQGRWTL